MDIKSKNTNNEYDTQQEIKANGIKQKIKEKRKLKIKSINIKSSVLYSIIAVLLIVVILSALEIRDNLRFIIPDKIYTQTQLADNINNYTNLVNEYSLYYKSDNYSGDNKNITQNDIDICKQELQDKIDSEYNDFCNSKYNSDSFISLEYDKQQQVLEAGRQEIEKKYTLTDEKMTEYILSRKSNSENELNNKIDSYVNLRFSAYDKLNDIWIGRREDIAFDETRDNSRYFKEINIDYNGNVIEKQYVDGKEINPNSLINRFIDRYSFGGRYSYLNSYSASEMATYPDGSYNMYSNEEKHNLTLYIWIPRNIQAGDLVYESFIQVNKNVKSSYTTLIVFGISLTLLIICIIYLLKNKKSLTEIDSIINKVKEYPIEYKIGAGILALILWNSGAHIYYDINDYIRRLNLSSIMWGYIAITICYLLIRIIIINYKEGKLLKNNISSKIYDYINEIMKRSSILKSIAIIVIIYIIAGLILFLLDIVISEFFPVFLIAGVIMTIAFVVLAIKKLVYLDKIMAGAKDAAEGKLNYTIQEKGRGHLKELAHNINNIKEGLRESIQNEMKSENMKTELITNVSHDLKTPLTSIINYIDLLKREDIEPESARDYVNVLDKKAQRLKVLIEDLFEASKVASGAMELNITKIDIGQLLKQALGENDERFNDKSLEVKLNIPEEKVFINGDGQRIYRVFENLISNAAKYSLSNTRVYIDMFRDKDNEVVIIMKNISAYELDFDSDEITNRFKRGDASRSTEGSGLGLAIAKSIVELHGGKFNIQVDGDLFKSIIKIK